MAYECWARFHQCHYMGKVWTLSAFDETKYLSLFRNMICSYCEDSLLCFLSPHHSCQPVTFRIDLKLWSPLTRSWSQATYQTYLVSPDSCLRPFLPSHFHTCQTWPFPPPLTSSALRLLVNPKSLIAFSLHVFKDRYQLKEMFLIMNSILEMAVVVRLGADYCTSDIVFFGSIPECVQRNHCGCRQA